MRAQHRLPLIAALRQVKIRRGEPFSRVIQGNRLAQMAENPVETQPSKQAGMTMTPTIPPLAIDFGTSNSAAGLCVDGRAHLIELEKGQKTLPTAVFFDFEDKTTAYGSQANQALFDGAWGRYMRALKSLLGTSLMRESSLIFGKRLTYIQIVARFLQEIKSRAEAQTGLQFESALSGRPVRFHDDPERSDKALEDLRQCYLEAGFRDVAFMNEPEAAAYARLSVLKPADLGLVIDIGGGTSDFTLFQTAANGGIDILHSDGMRLGGTDFDRLLNLEFAMPLAGKGSQIRHAFGSQTHTAPNALFNDLATWQKIPFLYAPEPRRAAKELYQYAAEPDKLARLVRILEDERGHDLAFAVEAAKIAANESSVQTVPLALDALERHLTVDLARHDVSNTLTPSAERIGEKALQTTKDAQVDPALVTHLILVGGSSLMQSVQSAVQSRFPAATPHLQGAMTGIIEGLALSSG